MRPPFQYNRVDTQLLVESQRDRTNGQHAYRACERAAACDDVTRCRRDVVAARGGRVSHKDDDRFPGADAFDLAPDQIRSQRVAAWGVDVEQNGGDPPGLLRHPQRPDDGLAPRLLTADKGEREGQSPIPASYDGTREGDERDLLSRLPPVWQQK